LDELEVLKWVQTNIANFGGDPTKVTVAGQSFGSNQVYHAVNNPLFAGYFRGAISQGGLRYPYNTILAGLAISYIGMSSALANGINYHWGTNTGKEPRIFSRQKSTEERL
jgi:carboxylesterase 2